MNEDTRRDGTAKPKKPPRPPQRRVGVKTEYSLETVGDPKDRRYRLDPWSVVVTKDDDTRSPDPVKRERALACVEASEAKRELRRVRRVAAQAPKTGPSKRERRQRQEVSIKLKKQAERELRRLRA